MLYATKRELLEGLIVAELIARPGQGPLARRHFPLAGGPASGVRSVAERATARAQGAPASTTSGPPPVPRATSSDDEEPR